MTTPIKPLLINAPNVEDLRHIVAALNANDERGAELRSLVERWKASGPNLQKMVQADEKLWSDLKNAWPAEWIASKGPRAFYVPLPSGIGHDKGTPVRRARFLFSAFVLNPRCEFLGGPWERRHRYYIKSRITQKRFCGNCFGSRCAGIASAKRSNVAIAKAEGEALLRCAAKFWSRSAQHNPLERSQWIADKVNSARKIMTLNGKRKRVTREITKKWVSRNRIAIQQLAKEESI